MESVNYPVPSTKSLEVMMEAQKKLVDHYIAIEGLPNYPVDLSTKRGQLVIRDFTDRLIEEMAESFTAYLALLDTVTNNEPEKGVPALEEFNIEIADCTHFLLELLIFSDIDCNQLKKYFSDLSNSLPELSVVQWEDNLLQSFLHLGWLQNHLEGVNTTKNVDKRALFKVVGDSVVMANPWLAAGQSINTTMVEEVSKLMWQTTYFLKKAVNHLKRKNWSQGEEIGSVLSYKEDLIKAITAYFQWMDAVGNTASGMHYSYFIKNNTNQNRIKNGY